MNGESKTKQGGFHHETKGTPKAKRRPIEYSVQWQTMRSRLPTWILEIAKLPGNDIRSSEFDRRVSLYSQSDVCTQCKIDAAFQMQERLKDYNKRFISLESSPYLSRLREAGRGACSCKRPAN